MKRSSGRIDIAALGRQLVLERPVAWALAAFLLFAWYAQFITHISWNAIELIIAQNLIEHGVFATSLDYPSAITWRPVVPTLVVTALRLLTEDPLTLYRIFCGGAVATLTVSLFLTARRLSGLVAAHVAAALTLACPAVTSYLVNHPHSYSHWGAILTLGPAILLSVRLLCPRPDETTPVALYALGGACWGLAYLSRSELLLFAGIAFLALLALQRPLRRTWRPLLAWLIPFGVLAISYNLHAGAAAARDGILIRKTVYTFYMSQGWVDPAPWGGADIEGDGYRYAIQLYGDPLANDENLLKTIAQNPGAFWRRVNRNLRGFYTSYGHDWFFRPAWAVAAVVMLLVGLRREFTAGQRLTLLMFAAFFFASHFVLLLHIDHRYLIITLPGLLLLAAWLAGWLVQQAGRLGTAPAWALGLALLAAVLWTARPQWAALSGHRDRDDRGVIAMRALGEHFRHHVPKPQSASNRQPHILFQFPEPSPLRPEEQFLVAYFTRTSWVNGGAEGTFPRGRFYSYRDRPLDYLYLPESRLDQFPGARSRVIARHHNPVLGDYYLVAGP